MAKGATCCLLVLGCTIGLDASMGVIFPNNAETSWSDTLCSLNPASFWIRTKRLLVVGTEILLFIIGSLNAWPLGGRTKTLLTSPDFPPPPFLSTSLVSKVLRSSLVSCWFPVFLKHWVGRTMKKESACLFLASYILSSTFLM